MQCLTLSKCSVKFAKIVGMSLKVYFTDEETGDQRDQIILLKAKQPVREIDFKVRCFFKAVYYFGGNSADSRFKHLNNK